MNPTAAAPLDPPLRPTTGNVVGAFARRVLDARDLSALTPLLDELTERARWEDAREVRQAFAELTGYLAGENRYFQPFTAAGPWVAFKGKLRKILFWDVWTWDSGLVVAETAVAGVTPADEMAYSTGPTGEVAIDTPAVPVDDDDGGEEDSDIVLSLEPNGDDTDLYPTEGHDDAAR